MNDLGFGGRAQHLIESIYTNDRIYFEVNNEPTATMYMTKGVRQGCNLSPTLFNFLMKKVADRLQATNTGIWLADAILSAIIYADDICICARSPSEAVKAFTELKAVCNEIGLVISLSKSQMIRKGDRGVEVLVDVPLELVLFSKYLGVELRISRALYMVDYSKGRAVKAKSYAISTINMARDSPCPSLFAWRLWVYVALPAIFYGAETVLIRDEELTLIEREQNRVAKFILGVPQSATNVATQVLCGLESIRIYYWRKVLNYFAELHVKEEHTWVYKAFKEMITVRYSFYRKIITNQLELMNIENPQEIADQLKVLSVTTTNQALEDKHSTMFCCKEVTFENPTRFSPMFYKDNWSSTFHEFLICDANLGNRTPYHDWDRILTCKLCGDEEVPMNEVHMLLGCPALHQERIMTGIEDFIRGRRSFGLPKIYAEFWTNSTDRRVLRKRVDAAVSMRNAYYIKLAGIIEEQTA